MLVLDDFASEVEVDSRRIKLPNVVIGSGTMDKYGIVLDPREGVKFLGAHGCPAQGEPSFPLTPTH